MNVGPAAHLSGQMSGQAAQMNQVAGSSVGSADGHQQHQPMQDGGAFSATDTHFVMLRTAMRQKIYEYIGRKQTMANWQKRLPELAKRLEEILYQKFPNMNDYYNMMKGPIEPQLQFAIKTLSAQVQQNQQNPQVARRAPSSSSTDPAVDHDGHCEQLASLQVEMQKLMLTSTTELNDSNATMETD
ncbi:hypothetical protein BS78_04G033000 [Paspalum vaginatum]|nr:hypothetical protein BS78_04G033000 [Paspalum vaginatum]KAJ1277828.1 hypothetical protein BS78_04G033000 [Paspalum vaginatum]